MPTPTILIKVYDFVFTVNLENRLKETVMEGQVQKADKIISYWSSPTVKMNGLVSIQKMNYEELKFFGKLPELQSSLDRIMIGSNQLRNHFYGGNH